jgi:hypothetical protein
MRIEFQVYLDQIKEKVANLALKVETEVPQAFEQGSLQMRQFR